MIKTYLVVVAVLVVSFIIFVDGAALVKGTTTLTQMAQVATEGK